MVTEEVSHFLLGGVFPNRRRVHVLASAEPVGVNVVIGIAQKCSGQNLQPGIPLAACKVIRGI